MILRFLLLGYPRSYHLNFYRDELKYRDKSPCHNEVLNEKSFCGLICGTKNRYKTPADLLIQITFMQVFFQHLSKSYHFLLMVWSQIMYFLLICLHTEWPLYLCSESKDCYLALMFMTFTIIITLEDNDKKQSVVQTCKNLFQDIFGSCKLEAVPKRSNVFKMSSFFFCSASSLMNLNISSNV